MEVRLFMMAASQPMVYDALNTYSKDGMYCILFKGKSGRTVHKYPIDHIFRVEESYDN